jgi:hypothetical protein
MPCSSGQKLLWDAKHVSGKLVEGIIMLSRVTIALVAGLATVCPGLAKDVKIGSVTVALPAPDGYCELIEREPSDARALKIFGDLLAKMQSELLAVAADCGQLKDWRVGAQPVLDDYVQYQTLQAARDADLSGRPVIKEECATLRTQGEKMVAALGPDAVARVEEAVKGAKLNEPVFLGVLAEDAKTCYFGLLQKGRTEAGTEKTQLTVSATTIVKGKLVYYNYYALYRGIDTASETLARHQRNVAALLAANGG